jgi:glycosyltransferase involved in cell wall biosynthesis
MYDLDIDHVSDLTHDLDLSRYNCVFCPSIMIDKEYIIKNPNIKFIFGPHLSVFPDERFLNMHHPNVIYITPSEWVKTCFKSSPYTHGLDIRVLPFGVDTDRFKPDNLNRYDHVFIYFKHRYYQELDLIINELNKRNIKIIWIFNYDNKYREDYYYDVIKSCKWGVWVGAHESQGFALQEALSCNVPLLVWNVSSMNQEAGFNNPDVPATSIPYWSDECGEYFYHIGDFDRVYRKFINNLNDYRPREYILENLSVDVCKKKFLNLV